MTFILEKKTEYTAVHWYIPGPDKWYEPGRAYSKKIEKNTRGIFDIKK